MTDPRVAIGPFTGDYGGVNHHIENIVKYSELKPELMRNRPFSLYLSHNPLKEAITMRLLRKLRLVGVDISGRRVAKRMARDFDVVHLHGHPWWPEFYVRPKKPRAKYVHSVHQVYREEDYHSRKEWRYAEYMNQRMSLSMGQSEAVISVSKWQMPAIKELGHEPIYIPNGVNSGVFEKGDADAFRKKYTIGEDFFFFAGRPAKYKRPEHVVSVAQRNEDKRFVMVGAGVTGEGMEKYLGKKIPSNVTCLGEVPYEDVINGMNACRVFFLPSVNDTFPTVIMEAMSAKKAVVASDNAGPKEIARHGVDGFLFKPDDIDDIEMQCLSAWEKPELGLNGYKRVKEKFDWRVIIPQIDDVYRKVHAGEDIN